MQTFSYKMPSTFRLYLFGDNHEGSLMRSKDSFLEMRERIMKDSGAYVIEMGDCIEAIACDDRRYNVHTDSGLTPGEQCENIVRDYKPMKNKMLCMLDGNHPNKHDRIVNLVKDCVLAPMGIPGKYGTDSARVTLTDKRGDTMFRVFAWHGNGTIGSTNTEPILREAMEKVQVKRKLVEKAGDCLLMAMGHTHRLIVAAPKPKLYLYEKDGEIRQAYAAAGQGFAEYIPPESRWYCNTGGFLKMYGPMGTSSYVEKAGYDPLVLGYVRAEVVDRELVKVDKVFL